MAVSLERGGTRLIIDECRRRGLLRNQCAYVLATARHEVGAAMLPVRETFAKTDAEVKRRLTAAWKAGKLPQVKSDYWSGGYYGRGYPQTTHLANYRRASKVTGVDLVNNPDRMLEPAIAAMAMVDAMVNGTYRKGHSLGRYITLKASDFFNAREIVNGDKYIKTGKNQHTNGQIVADFAREYDAVLNAEGYGAEDSRSAPGPIVVEKPVVADPGELEKNPAKSKTVWTWLLTAIGAPLAAFGQLDWRVQILIVVVIVGFAVYGIKRRFDLAAAVKELKGEAAQ